jgi:SulP family sulfate permease
MSSALQRVRAATDRFAAQLTIGGPPLAWTLRGYRRESLRGDLVAGATVAALIVPLSIGYAQVAGLPPEAGLYASLIPLFAYAIFGSSRRLIVGPDAATAALVGAAITPLAVAADERMQIAAALALLVALIFVAMRLASLGFLAEFLSRPILVGYMTGVGVSVALGQIPKMLGADPLAEILAVLSGTDVTSIGPGVVLQSLVLAVADISISWPSVIVAALVLAAVVAGDRLLPGVPIALPALIVALVASVALDLPARGVQVLGPVPSGLPPISLPLVSVEEAIALLPAALGIAILSFADTAATGRNFARPGEEIDANRELVALSAADLGASLTSGYPIGSSPSRTSAALAAGSNSQLTGIVAAGGLVAVLLLLAPFLTSLPIPALGAVIVAAVLKLLSPAGIIRIWRLQRAEGIIALTAALGVILYGTLVGVVVAVALAALNVFRRSARPRIAELGRLPDSDEFADIERTSRARRIAGIAVVRFSGPLFFATATALRDRIRGILAERPDVRTVVLDAAGIVDLDLTAAGALEQLADELDRHEVRLLIARPTGTLRDLLRQYGLGRLIGQGPEVRRTIMAAVAAAGVGVHAVVTPPSAAADGGSDLGPEGGETLVGADSRPEVVEADGSPEGQGAGPPMEPPEPPRRWTAGLVVVGGVAVVGVLAVALLVGSGDAGPRPPAGEVVVPNLVGLPLERARQSAEARGLVLGEPTFISTTARPEGTVVAQTPAAGAVVAAGATILPAVSTGREIVEIPNVAGLSEAEAVVALTSAGLRVGGTTRVEDLVVPSGSVVSTSPAAGARVSTGTTVTLVVSAGPPPRPSPPPSPSQSAVPSPSPSPSPSSEPSPSSPAPSAAPSPGPSAEGVPTPLP